MFCVVIHSFKNRLSQLLTQFLTFLIYIPITSATEINAFKGTGRISTLPYYLLKMTRTVFFNDKCLTWIQLLYIITLQIKCRLKNWTFTCKDNDFVIFIIKCRSYSPGVAHRKHFPTARDATNDITTIKVGHCCL